MRSYWPAIIISVFLHSIIVAFVVWGWQGAPKPPEIKKPNYIKASLVELKQQSAPEKKSEKPKKPKKTEKPPEPKIDKKEEQRKAQKEKLRQQKIVEQQRKKEQEVARKNQLAKKKAEDKKKKALEDKREKERKEKRQKKEREQQRLAEQQEKERLKKIEREKKEQLEKKQREQELLQALSAEKAQIKAQKQAQADAVLAQSYVGAIQERVERNWSRPPSARNGMKVGLRIQLVPTGKVINVEVTSPSGDSAFDLSAVRAVRLADRFPELKDLPSRVFEQQFRTLNFIFIPEDLRQ